MALRNLWQAPRRTALLSAALAFVSMCMVLLMAMSQGLGETMVSAATHLLTGHVNVAGFYKTRPQNAATVVTDVDEIRRLANKYVQPSHMIDRPRGWGKLISVDGSLDALLAGVDIGVEQTLVKFINLAQEREYTDSDSTRQFGDVSALARPHTAILFAGQAERLGVRVGDMLTLSVETLGGVQNTDEVEVVAIARDAGYLTNRYVLVHQQTVRTLFALNDHTTGLVMLYVHNIDEADQIASALRAVLSAHGYSVMPRHTRTWRETLEEIKSEDWTGQRLDVTTWKDELGTTMWILQTLHSVTLLFVSLLMIIVVTGMINTMWIAVRERTQEIGMLRAIGMSRLRVLTMLLLEGVILSVCATTAGSLAGAAVATGLNAAQVHIPIDAIQTVLMNDVLSLVLRPEHVLRTIVCFSTVTALAALWPALRAARLQPLTAIQHVG